MPDPEPAPPPVLFSGLDLGQSQDPSALAVVELAPVLPLPLLVVDELAAALFFFHML